MSDLILRPEPAHTRADFAQRIEVILDRGWPSRVVLAPTSAVAAAGWWRDPDARLVLLLEGEQRYAWLERQTAQERRFTPGEVVWFAPRAAMREDWSTRCHFMSIVLRPHFLRFLIGRSRGDGRHPGTSPWSYHAALPLGEPGLLAARILDQLADRRGDPGAAREVLRSLLRFASEHASRCDESAGGKASATWRRVQEYVAAQCHREISRSGAARALGLSPTYLSDLCRRRVGGGFVRVVEAERLARARQLLRDEPALAIAAVARQVGFAHAGYFARVFRRATGQTPARWRAG